MHDMKVLLECPILNSSGAWIGLHTGLVRRTDGGLLAVASTSLLPEHLTRAAGTA